MESLLDRSIVIRVCSFFLIIIVFQVAVANLSLGKETKRRFQHAVTGHALVQISYLLPVEVCVLSLAIGCLTIVYVRLFKGKLYKSLFGPLLRQEELKDGAFPGAFYFLLGTMLTTSIFPIEIARYAVDCLSFADPFASFVGKSIQSPKISSSASVAGCFASFSAAFLLAAAVYHLPLKSALIGSIACTLSEAFPLANDNLTVPLATAAAVSFTLDPYTMR